MCKRLPLRKTAAIESIPLDMLERVWHEWKYRLDVCNVTRASHIECLGGTKYLSKNKKNKRNIRVTLSNATSFISIRLYTAKLYTFINTQCFFGHPFLSMTIVSTDVTQWRISVWQWIHVSNWSDHITNIWQKTFVVLHNLKRYRDFLSVNVRITSVQALIFPIYYYYYYYYYCGVLYGDIRGDLSAKLQRAHNACARFILDVRKYYISLALSQLSFASSNRSTGILLCCNATSCSSHWFP